MLQEELLKKIRLIELNVRRNVDTFMQGAYNTLFKGHGLEFQEVREYTEGEDVRMMDWNVTARTGKPHIRVYREERELTVMIAVDISGSSRFGRSWSGREVMATLAAAIAFSATRNNDKAGLILFSDRVECYLPPKRGRNHLLALIRTLLTAQPQGHRTDPDTACRFISQMLKKKSLAFFLSDMQFDELPRSLATIARRHEIVPVGVYDRTQYEKTDWGAVRVIDPETGKTAVLDFAAARERVWQSFKASREAAFKRLKMQPIWVENKEDFINDLILGFKRMERGR